MITSILVRSHLIFKLEVTLETPHGSLQRGSCMSRVLSSASPMMPMSDLRRHAFLIRLVADLLKARDVTWCWKKISFEKTIHKNIRLSADVLNLQVRELVLKKNIRVKNDLFG